MTALCALSCLFAASAIGEIDPVSGIDLVTISSAGNAAWTGRAPSPGTNGGRGAVGYEYRIGRMEVTTAQWAEFLNAALDRPAGDQIPHVARPLVWGANPIAPTNPGGSRFSVPVGNELRAAGGISWRTAAIYCNWLHNGKATNREAFLSGAYDVSTFGFFHPEAGGYTDQLTRSPGARYFVPSLDEWMKAAHYDPAKVNGDGSIGGWWEYSNRSDTAAPVGGPPGVLVNGQMAQANTGWLNGYPGLDAFTVPLGAYPQTQSPWGLLDMAGATAEWVEEPFIDQSEGFPRGRFSDGSPWRNQAPLTDSVWSRSGSDFPSFRDTIYGFRIAAAVIPSPGWVSVGVSGCVLTLAVRRRPMARG
ncbi:MAG TPA: SUMF1/EgtB/PvdO family nonheme iron enzyme [Phycisphaerales bacterium]|nr:SUMF1/EgtB/PvdO family nonheme iron enzyme [Phycisphaerales bacterium]